MPLREDLRYNPNWNQHLYKNQEDTFGTLALIEADRLSKDGSRVKLEADK